MIYKVRVILDTDNSKEQIFRDIEIKDKQTLWNLHLGIKSAFSLQGEELSSFYYADEDWSEGDAIPLEDMSDDGEGETMSDIYVKEAFTKVGDKMHFKYGLLDLWEFFCELLEINEEKPAVNYPITVFRFGNVEVPLFLKNPILLFLMIILSFLRKISVLNLMMMIMMMKMISDLTMLMITMMKI